MSDFDKKIEALLDQRSLDQESIDTKELDGQQVSLEMQLQARIDASLARSFSLVPVDDSRHRKKMEALISKSELKSRSKVVAVAWVLAASVLLLIGFASWQGNQGLTKPGFVRQPLAVLYEDAVERGFKPYYKCDDPERFAAQFEKQQGVALRLGEMPEHKQMVGISFLGGVSRKTTSMLGLVNGKPVLVLVDNLSNDDEQMRSQVGKSDQHHVSRTTKDGLVFYEISEFEDAQLVEYFERDDQR